MSVSWRRRRLDEIAAVNPARQLRRGELGPHMDLADVQRWWRSHTPPRRQRFSGGARFKNGDVLLARISPSLENGKAAWVRGLAEGEIGHGSTEFIVLAPREREADERFLYYLTRWPDFRGYAVRAMTGTSGRQRISPESVAGFTVPLPGLDDQTAIADVLGAIDDKIEASVRAATSAERLVHGLWQEAVGTAISTVPLDNLIEVNPPRRIATSGPAPYLPMSDMPTQGYHPAAVERREPGSGARFRNGDTLMARITPCLENGKVAYVDFLAEDEVGWGSTEYIVLKSRAGVPAQVPYLVARWPEFVAYATRNMTGTSGRQRCPAAAVEAFPVPQLPPSALQRISEITTPTFDLMRSLYLENDRLGQLRDSLIPELMSGARTVAGRS